MIRFIDLENGVVFNGNIPYVFRFDKEQSTNLNYVKKICILTDKQTLDIKIEDNDIFALLDIDGYIQNLPTNQQLNRLERNIIDLESSYIKKKQIISNGTTYNNYYIHMVYIIARSIESGEFIVDLYIDKETFLISGDFYNENECLAINLSNQGFEIPKAVEKAIYDFNIHEDGIDNILLNRKYKELLSEYINIIGNKGSYKSLINSLKWFEWGELVRIYEYWRHNEPSHPYLSGKDLESIINSRIEEMMINSHKTTYIGISYALTKFEDNNNPHNSKVLNNQTNITTIPEPVPGMTLNIDPKWSIIDVSLKMTLLGNFLSTYFFPLHLDLIHSTIEHIVYTDTIKLLSWNRFSREDYIFDIGSVECNIKDNSIYNLSNVKCRVYKDTTFGDQYDYNKTTYNDFNIFGVDTEIDRSISDDNELRTFLSQYFEGPGVILPFDCIIDNVQLNMPFDYIEILCCNKTTKETKYVKTYNIKNNIIESKPTGDKYNILFNILFTVCGEYQISINFHNINHKTYYKAVNITIKDEQLIDIDVFKIKKINNIQNGIAKEIKDIMLKDNIFNYIFSLDRNNKEVYYRQFITHKCNNILSTIGLNQAIIIELHDKQWITFKDNNNTSYEFIYDTDIVSIDDDIIEYFNSIFPTYQFSIRERFNEDITYKQKYLYGINLEYSCKDKLYILRKKILSTTNNICHECKLNFGVFLHKKTNIGPDMLSRMSIFLNILGSSHKITSIDIKNIRLRSSNFSDNNLYINKQRYYEDRSYNIYKYTNIRINAAVTFGTASIPLVTESLDLIITFKDGTQITYNVIIPEVTLSTNKYITRLHAGSIQDITRPIYERVWLGNIFIPMLHVKERLNERIIDKGEVIEFVPTLTKMKNHNSRWIFKNCSTNNTIKLLSQDHAVLTPISPLLVNYEHYDITERGYYDVYLRYELDNGSNVREYRSKSQIIIK